MKKIIGILIGFFLFAAGVFAFNLVLDSQITANKEVVRNNRGDARFQSSETLRLAMDENTLPIFGSSELLSLQDVKDSASFLNSEDMNILTIGRGYYQSLHHVFTLGAIADDIPNKTAALFLSPQWFSEYGVKEEALSSRFSEDEFLGFLANKNISDSTKKYAVDRAKALMTGSPTQYKRIEKYAASMENKISLNTIYRAAMSGFWKTKAELNVVREIDGMETDIPVTDLKNMDWEAMYANAERLGEQACTNNDFGIEDSYWDTYVKDVYERGEVAEKKQTFNKSKEYDDLKCFLDVAEQCGIEILLVSIPVHEKWYSYQGMLCDEYYDNIRKIAGEYSNVKLIDMSVYAGEKYFLRDVMHLGWKGWVRINEALYKEFKK